MLRIEIIAAGRMKNGPHRTLWDEYAKQMTPWTLKLTEIEGQNTADEHKKLAAKIDPSAFLFVLDEKGKSLASKNFATKLDGLATEARPVQFIIGGADGLPQIIRDKAGFLLSFGIQTWPHMMVRVMLAEQIYRAKQILAGHPYHRE